MIAVEALAPAKLNLGLEVLGRRPDGFHEIVTVMQTVSIFDRLIVEPASELRLAVSNARVAGGDNLALKAARLLREQSNIRAGAWLTLRKRIPDAAGLGGASSDAAAALLALARLWRVEPDAVVTPELAASLGSDVPFFLGGGTALVTGRGERCLSLPRLAGWWFVVVVPPIDIPRKTATLYAALQTGDFSSGARVRSLAESLTRAEPLVPALLANAFTRPLLALRPEIAGVQEALARCGAPFVALTGAGPAHYTAVPEHERARAIASCLRARLWERVGVFVCRPVGHSPLIQTQANGR